MESKDDKSKWRIKLLYLILFCLVTVVFASSTHHVVSGGFLVIYTYSPIYELIYLDLVLSTNLSYYFCNLFIRLCIINYSKFDTY